MRGGLGWPGRTGVRGRRNLGQRLIAETVDHAKQIIDGQAVARIDHVRWPLRWGCQGLPGNAALQDAVGIHSEKATRQPDDFA